LDRQPQAARAANALARPRARARTDLPNARGRRATCRQPCRSKARQAAATRSLRYGATQRSRPDRRQRGVGRNAIY